MKWGKEMIWEKLYLWVMTNGKYHIWWLRITASKSAKNVEKKLKKVVDKSEKG